MLKGVKSNSSLLLGGIVAHFVGCPRMRTFMDGERREQDESVYKKLREFAVIHLKIFLYTYQKIEIHIYYTLFKM